MAKIPGLSVGFPARGDEARTALTPSITSSMRATLGSIVLHCAVHLRLSTTVRSLCTCAKGCWLESDGVGFFLVRKVAIRDENRRIRDRLVGGEGLPSVKLVGSLTHFRRVHILEHFKHLHHHRDLVAAESA